MSVETSPEVGPAPLPGDPLAAADLGTAPASAAPRTRRAVDVVGPMIGFVIFIGLWWLAHAWLLENVFDKPSFLIPSPPTVVDRAFLDATVRGDLVQALGWTAFVAFSGLLISIVLGMTIAVLMAQATWVERSFWPYLIAAQAIPILAIVPIIGNIFGFGFGSRILVCVIISIFPIVSNTLFGLLSADRSQHDLFTLGGASRRIRLWKLQLPAALPAMFTGFRIASGLSVIGAVVGELFFRKGGKGIGLVMDVFRQRNQNPPMFGALILSALLGITFFAFFGWLGKLVVGRWHETTRKTG